MIPPDVAAAWGWTAHAIEPVGGGLINATFVVRDGQRAIAALQRLHAIFGPEVNLDLEFVTTHLAAQNLETPRLLRTMDGRAWIEHDGKVWRATSWVEGESVPAIPDPSWAAASGALVGKFHRAMADLDYAYRFARAGVHDTARHMARLAEHIAAQPGASEATALGREILDAAQALPNLSQQPLRHVHGDLKISNVIFRRDPTRAVALVDLDTLGRGTLAYELGDAMRSWCNRSGEDANNARFELAIFAAAVEGFLAVAHRLITREERSAIPSGLETICLELAARFAVDVFDDCYFGWNPARFASRREHNAVRARGQLALAHQVRALRSDLLDIVLAGS